MNEEEKSILDITIVSEYLLDYITKMIIDKTRNILLQTLLMQLLKNLVDSDHNATILDINPQYLIFLMFHPLLMRSFSPRNQKCYYTQ